MMENKRLKLPIGIQTFEEIRKKGYLYVDKTKYLVDLIDNGKIYFLARPRRFGKSVMISTFEALFSGNKELFKGLYAEEFLNRPDFEPSPVIWLDMSQVDTDNGLDALKESINEIIGEIAEQMEVDIPKNLPSSSLLRKLIINTARKYNQQVVILLDEYDAPYTNFVNDSDMAEKVRDILRNFYVQIKANDRYIRFTFITGISKFARFGVFSTLNTPLDISLMPEYAEVCGYTEDEISNYFPDYLEDTANKLEISAEELIEKMRNYYNGFCFDGKAKSRLYNPYSTLTFFKHKKFSNYWIHTGRSKMIADYMKNRNLTVEQFRNFPISEDFAESPGDMDTTPPEGFLNQAGYLTLRPGITNTLSLDYPNTEVLNSMSELLTKNILAENYNYFQNDLFSALLFENAKKLVEVFNHLLASIPYDDYVQAANQNINHNGYKFSAQEWLYRSNILSFLQGCGVVVFAEMHTNLGRADLVVSHKGKTWVIELKVAYEGESPKKKVEDAMQQIKDKNYATPYPNAICIAMAIDNTVRQITDVRCEM